MSIIDIKWLKSTITTSWAMSAHNNTTKRRPHNMDEPKFWQNAMFLFGLIILIAVCIIISIVITHIKNKKKRRQTTLSITLTKEELNNAVIDSFDSMFNEWFAKHQNIISQNIRQAVKVDLLNYIVIDHDMFMYKYKALLKHDARLCKSLKRVFPNMDVDIKYIAGRRKDPLDIPNKFPQFVISWYIDNSNVDNDYDENNNRRYP